MYNNKSNIKIEAYDPKHYFESIINNIVDACKDIGNGKKTSEEDSYLIFTITLMVISEDILEYVYMNLPLTADGILLDLDHKIILSDQQTAIITLTEVFNGNHKNKILSEKEILI